MILEKFKYLGFLLGAISICYLIHKMIFFIFNLELNLNKFNFSLEELYFLFTILSLLITSISIFIKQKNIDLVGNVFVLITSIKLIGCFLFIQPYVSNKTFNNSLEKWNYFSLFLLFLILETSITVFILNKKKN